MSTKTATEASDISGLLLTLGALAVLVGGLSFSGQEVAKFLLPVFVLAFAAGAWGTYRKQLRGSAEVFASVAIGLSVYELWVVFQPRSYGSFSKVVDAWARGDGPTLATVGAIAAGMIVVTAVLALELKRKGIPLVTPVVWLAVAVGVGVLTELIYLIRHDVSYFEIVTLPAALALVGVAEYVMARNEKATSLETLTWGLLVGFIPTSIAAYFDVLGYHAIVLTVLFVVALGYGAVMRRKAVFALTPWFYLVYCLCAIVSVGHDIKPWVWLMVGGTMVIGCGVFWEKLYREVRAGRSRLSELR